MKKGKISKDGKSIYLGTLERGESVELCIDTESLTFIEDEVINLGKKGFWYYVRLILTSPMWFFHTPRNWVEQLIDNPELGKDIPINTSVAEMEQRFPTTEKKSWSEFKGGLIKHKCQFDYDNIQEPDKFGGYVKCKHYGCNLANIRGLDGNWM